MAWNVNPNVKQNYYLISDKINEENKLLLVTNTNYGNMELTLLPYKYFDSYYLYFAL